MPGSSRGHAAPLNQYLREFANTHQNAETPLDDWYRTAKRLHWTSLVDGRKTYRRTDAVGEYTIFNNNGSIG